MEMRWRYRLSLGIAAALSLMVWGLTHADVPDAWEPVRSLSPEERNQLYGMQYNEERDILYFTTRQGVFAFKDAQVYRVAESELGLMGFVLHPENRDVLVISGIPRAEGGLGLLRSPDRGVKWGRLAEHDATGDFLDFTAMAVSHGNPDRLYGVARETLYRSDDGGDSWTTVAADGLPLEDGPCWGGPCLGAASDKIDRLYAGTREGLFRSDDGGETWSLEMDAMGGVAGVTVDPGNPDRIFAFTQSDAIVVSQDGGETWEEAGQGFTLLAPHDFVFDFAMHPGDPNILFAATPSGIVNKSEDGGESWDLILSIYLVH